MGPGTEGAPGGPLRAPATRSIPRSPRIRKVVLESLPAPISAARQVTEFPAGDGPSLRPGPLGIHVPSHRRPPELATEAFWERESRPGSGADPGSEADPLVRAPLGIEGTFPIPGAPMSCVHFTPWLDSVLETPPVSVAFAPAATDAAVPWREELGLGARVRSWLTPIGPRRRRER